MARIITDIPDISMVVSHDNPGLFLTVQNVHLSGRQLNATVSDGLSEEAYDKISKEIRILFSFCFGQVYSEDYNIQTITTHFGHSGQNERKQHLLNQTINYRDEFQVISKQLFHDILGTSPTARERRTFFNCAYVWSRAQELDDIKLSTEAYTQFWRLLDRVMAASKISTSETNNVLEENGLDNSKANIFAVKVLHKMSLINKSARANIESLAMLDRLRHPHAHQTGGRQDYYLEEETHIEAEIHNNFISDITQLFIVWELGLKDYYLKPRANIYELAKRKPDQ